MKLVLVLFAFVVVQAYEEDASSLPQSRFLFKVTSYVHPSIFQDNDFLKFPNNVISQFTRIRKKKKNPNYIPRYYCEKDPFPYRTSHPKPPKTPPGTKNFHPPPKGPSNPESPPPQNPSFVRKTP